MIDYAPLAYRVESMRSEDISAVMEIEQVAFSAPWSARAYDYELHYNEMAYYFVARPNHTEMAASAARTTERHRRSGWRRWLPRGDRSPHKDFARPPVVGYGGMWLMVDEAHISTIASHPNWRGRGVGELLLVAMIDRAAEVNANVVTLEVRVSNMTAQSLYRKYGFQTVGQRRGYYSDNGEDALIMTTPPITSATYNRLFQENKSALFKRLA